MDKKSKELQKRIKTDSICTRVIAGGIGILAIAVLIALITSIVDPKPDQVAPEIILGNLVRIVFVFVTFIILSMFMQDLYKTGKPFTKKSITRLRAIAIISMIGAVLPELVSSIAGMFDADAVFTLEVNFADIIIILLAAVFGILSEVFEYGYELQQEMDEIA